MITEIKEWLKEPAPDNGEDDGLSEARRFLWHLLASLSAAEKERQGLKESVDRLRRDAEIYDKQAIRLTKEASTWITYAEQNVARLTAERDTALRERDRFQADTKMLDCQIQRWRQSSNRHLAKLIRTKGEVEQLRQAYGGALLTCRQQQDRATIAESALTSIKTALGCPDLPVEELAGRVGEVVRELAASQDHREEVDDRCTELLDLNDQLTKERDMYQRTATEYKNAYIDDCLHGEAFTKGAESMRLRAANAMRRFHTARVRGDAAASVIMDIPIHPKEG